VQLGPFLMVDVAQSIVNGGFQELLAA
jgi:hypothetical protein